ncbi:Monomeric sarcosine oxidase [Planctomycetes bacterium Pan216]|uniref:Monomeric sarcosine oxidase n=1 Tax=Kolteria novifilia TaxID=2527975 RepID=A0A518BD29_9BACT|nr:Monomeric sarcosine oxidase [Planctomycetes bacterium Pan216]
MTRPHDTATFHTLVLGGGILGLAALYHLTRMGHRPVGLVERFTLGHSHGSSHGASRIIRSTYGDVDYVHLMQPAVREEWPRLQRDAGEQLIIPVDSCFYGTDGPAFNGYVDSATAAGADVERLDPDEARKHFPLFRFPGAKTVLRDHTAGMIAASRTMSALARWSQQHGGQVLDQTRVRAIELDRDPIRLVTDRGTLATERLIVAVGAWTGALVPSLAPRLKVHRQTVGYFRLEGPAERMAPEHFPVWFYVQDREDIIYYGLPAFGTGGVKTARHDTMSPESDDPEELDRPIDESVLATTRAFLDEHLSVAVDEVDGAEHCLYTCTANEDFVLGPHPDNPRVVVAAGGSGHAFKFGPLLGRVLAELAVEGRSSVPEFEAMSTRFQPT